MNNSIFKTNLKKYEPLSLAKSIYAITSWISNRNYIGLTDTLNRIYIEIEEKTIGDKEILTYEHFKNLFEEIVKASEKFLHPMYCEPFPIDTGEVKYYSGGKFQKIFIGNGSEDIYEGCFLIESIVHGDEYLKSVWQEILDYEDLILSKLYLSNLSQSNEFECPPKEYFDIIFENYELLKNPKLKLFFQNFKSFNEELYDFFTRKNGYPIFLPMLKETFLEKIEQDLTKEQIKSSVWSALTTQLKNNFYLLESRGLQSLFSIIFVENSSDNKIIFNESFALFGKNNIVIFLPNDSNEELIVSLNQGVRNGEYTIAGFSPNGDLLGTEFQTEINVIFQKVDDMDISPNKTKIMMFSEVDDSYIDIKGLMGIINFASDIEEIIEFIIYLREKKYSEKMINHSGITSFFQIWKDMDKVIIEGASEVMLIVPSYQSVEKTIELFKDDLLYYPYDGGISFSNVHHWNLVTETKADLSLNGKGGSGSADIFMLNDKAIAYQELHFIIEDIDQKTIETITSFHEIILNGFNEYKNLILSLFTKQILEINLVSEKILNKNAVNSQIFESEYCKKIIIDTEENSQILLIRPNWEKIFNDNISIESKSFENDLLLSFLTGGSFISKETLESEIKKSDKELRTSSISQIEVPYFVEPHVNFQPPQLSSFKNVRKIMAQTVKKIGLEPKSYEESEILGVIKRFRNEVRDDLIQKLETFDKFVLHKRLLDIYSAILFQITIHQERIAEFSSITHLREESLREFREKAIGLREESKTYRQVLEYLMEENLISKQQEIVRIPTSQEVDELIAYSKWILDFQTMSDALSYGAVGWNQLEIREDYVVEIEETDKYLKDMDLLTKLRYTYGDYSYRDKELDKAMFEVLDKEFQTETELSLKSLFTTLTLLYSNSYISDLIEMEDVRVTNNIVEAPIGAIVNLFVEETKLPLEEFFKALTFITIDIDKISDKSGIIPVWEKKKRKNKLSAQPVLINGNHLIFSPISLYELEKSWRQGMMNFILPYNVGLEKTTKALDSWKDNYEHKIVADLASLFDDSKYDVYPDKELYKLDPKGNHPRDLGDYDLIVINKEKKEILLFEVKYMRLSQTMKDFLGDQGKYFINNKAKAKQFEKRVLYFHEHINQIISNLGFKNDFTIKKYFLSNKNIRSFFKEYPFEVTSFNEFESTYFK